MKGKRTLQRILSLLLVCTMILSTPLSALATDELLISDTAEIVVDNTVAADENEPVFSEPAETGTDVIADASAAADTLEEAGDDLLIDEGLIEDDSPGQPEEAPAEEITEAVSEEETETDEAIVLEEPESETSFFEEETETEDVLFVDPADSVKVYLTVNNKGVLASAKDGSAMVNREVTVSDVNKDGVLTYNEAMIAAHAIYNSEDGYVTSGTDTSDEGSYVSVTRFWGVDTYNTLYYLNGTALVNHVGHTGTSVIKADDHLVASVNKDDIYYSDRYSAFDVSEKTVETGEEFTLKLAATLSSGSTAVSGVSVGIWKDGSFVSLENKTTGTDGNATLSFPEAGTYIVTAQGTVSDTVSDWSSGTEVKKTADCPLIAPACVVTVSAAEQGPKVIAEGDCGKTASDQVTWKLTEDGVLTISGTGAMKSYNSWTKPGWNSYASQILSLVVENGVTSIGDYAFNGCTVLNSISLPETVVTIGQWAFANCPALVSAEIPVTVTSFGASVFRACTGLTSVVINSPQVGDYAFYDCAKLENAVIGEKVTQIGNMSFRNTGLKEIIIPSNVDNVAMSAFAYCSSLEKVVINSANVGSYAFQQCPVLKTVVIGNKLTNLSKEVFRYCPELESLTVDPENSSIIIQDDVLYSSDGQTLQFCVPAKKGEIIIKEGTTAVAQEAFSGCTGVTAISMPESMNTLEMYAFEGCTGLARIELPASIDNLNGYAFKNCSTLQEISVKGNKYVVKDHVLYTADETTLVLCPPAQEGEVIIPEGVTAIADAAFFYCSKITGVTFPSTLNKIGEDGFCGCASLQKVEMPDTVTEVGPYVFQECASLYEVKLSANLTVIPTYMFYACSNLKNVELPAGLTEIGRSSFAKCSVLERITIPEGVTTIYQQAFQYCESLQEAILPSTLTTLQGGTTFTGCSSLKKLVIPDGVKAIPSSMCQDCTSLESVVLPEGITSIGGNAFATTTGSSFCIYFKGSPAQWNSISGISSLAWVKHLEFYYGIPEDDSMINAQPEGASYQEGTESENIEPLSVRAKALVEGENYHFTWYHNTKDSTEGGTAINGSTVSTDGRWSYYVPDASSAGTYYYYCIVEKRDSDNKILKYAISEVAEVTITLDVFDGSGNAKNPYQIGSQEDLTNLYQLVADGINMEGMYFQMTQDITLDDTWNSIGVLKPGTTSAGNGKNMYPFSGIFDGGGYTLTFAKGSAPLFGYVREATVKNLNIFGEYIAEDGLVANYVVDYGSDGSYSSGTGGSYTAGCPDTIDIINVTIKSGTSILGNGFLGGYASGGNIVNISNCKVENNVKIGWNAELDAPARVSAVGSMAGSFNGTMVNCISYADVYGVSAIGGLIGNKGQSMGLCSVMNSQFHGTVSATSSYAGGIVGKGYGADSAPNTPGVSIQYCYVSGKITGKDYVGGIYGGESAQAQAWGDCYITDNQFVGTVIAEEGSRLGGIIGYMRSMNCHNVIENNTFLKTCGASKGIGGALYVDTSSREHGWTEDHSTYYMNTSVDDLAVIKQETDPTNRYTPIAKTGLNRADDPLGADSDKLAVAVDQTGDPVEKIAYKLTISGNYRTDYYIGEELDLDGMELTALWTDGTETKPGLEELTVTGFDSSKRGNYNVVLSYGAAKETIQIKVLKRPDNKIGVFFTLLGDEVHDVSSDGVIHTLKAGNLTTWIPKKIYEVDLNATVKDVLELALKENNMTCSNPSGNYVVSITKGNVTLGEFDNGTNLSGWMYTLNDMYPDLGVSEQYLNDGDNIVFHFTDDYTQEHKHRWNTDEWTSDSTGHWHSCDAWCPITDNTQKNGYAVHTSGDWILDNTVTGAKHKECIVCGYVMETVSDHVCTWDAGTVTKEPTCTETGIMTFKCICGAVKTEVIPAIGHKYGDWIVSEKATVFSEEKQQHTCSACGYTETRSVGQKLTPVLEVPGNLKSITMQKGKTAKFTLTMAGGDSIVSVKSASSKYLKVTSYDKKKGSISLKAVKKGSTKLTIQLASGKTRTYKVTVTTGTVPTSKITGVEKKVTLQKGKSITLKPVLVPFTGTQKFTYKTSNKKAATVTSQGKVKGVAPGTAVITVTSGKKSVKCTVTVPGISNVKSSVTLNKGKTLTLKPKLYGISQKASYTSSNTKVVTVTSSGKIKGIQKGTATITVKAGSYTVKCKVKVK